MARTREFDIDLAVDRAMNLFWRRGYAETSLQDLLKELSIGSGSFYAAFGSKEQLYLRTLERYVSLQHSDLEKILDGAPEIRSAVRTMLASLIEMDMAEPTRGCLVVSTATQCADQPWAAERVNKAILQVEGILAGALERAQARGEISADKNPRELARFLTTFVQGIRIVGAAQVGREFVADAVNTAVRTLD
ncbi:TetR/AcrR family transcriptional regulator [Streptomyces cocklensis]|jgi:TetR/AcrR family transcriptional repressor of nem operon|uniref:TetR family transcriptional regulator n=1 Tax=Actinacidiphila cocklensis TaxID=887465 RepID=A0A9W4DZX7_9ACTN|nr:TetR/AcrR family transcriptional regulator [Actinacidiphila cocklensis]MDD1058554.1 TetR/AcrR family transcriptional regulator [Actinacidiphila cocklensis]CAG6390723.1 TetR family transcriptional regulator [Actinacidiphila cocklensis]